MASSRGHLDSTRIARYGLAAGAMLVAVWPLALTAFRRANVYHVMGPFAVAVIAVNVALARAAGVNVINRRRIGADLTIGLACGVVMTVLTYVAYGIGVRIVPRPCRPCLRALRLFAKRLPVGSPRVDRRSSSWLKNRSGADGS